MNDSNGDKGWSRRIAEALGFAAVIALFWGLDTLTKLQTRHLSGSGLDDFRLIAEQITSGLSVFLLVPAVAWWLRRFPLTEGPLASRIAGHLLGSVLFAVCHYFLSVAMRALVYPIFGRQYIFSSLWLQNLWVEFQKDLKIYVAIVAIIAAYRYFRARPESAVDFSDRMVVQTGTGQRIIQRADIECLEAARNYVTVHTDGKELLVRQTLSRLAERLEPHGFVRTHRSWLVNIEAVAELRSDGGGWEIEMRSGRKVPLSRSYRDKFRAIFGG